MKKYFTLMLMAIFSVAAVSCTDRNDDVIAQDNDTYSVVLDINNVSFANTGDGYNIKRSFTKPLVSSDVVLIYRRANPNANTNDPIVWQSIPRTLYLTNGELDYDFDFTVNDIMIYANGNYDISTTPAYLTNQTFRVVLVPASVGGKNANVDYSDYNSVIKYFKIDDSQVKTL